MRFKGVAVAVSVLLVGPLLAAAAPSQAAAVTNRLEARVETVVAEDLYELAAEVAGGDCASSAGSVRVALASGENWPDALAGAALDRPVLLTRGGSLPAATRRYLEPCAGNPKAKVTILGGAAAVSADVAVEIEALGFAVKRVAGRDRYDTARRTARRFAPDDGNLPNVFLASGESYADAAAAGPRVTKSAPLILTGPDRLHESARGFLLDDGFTVGRVTILGGPAAVSEAVEVELRRLGVRTWRLAGKDRYETAAWIARQPLHEEGCPPVRDVMLITEELAANAALAAASIRGPCQPMLYAPPDDGSSLDALVSFGIDWSTAAPGHDEAVLTAVGLRGSAPSAAAMRAVATGRTGPRPGGDDWAPQIASVVRVVCTESDPDSPHIPTGATTVGTGFAVGDGRQIVTNHHVIVDANERDCLDLRIQAGGTLTEALRRNIDHVTVVAADKQHDLAWLRIPDSEPAFEPLGLADEPISQNAEVTVLGYPTSGGQTASFCAGRGRGLYDVDGVVWGLANTQVGPGSSGSPVLNNARQVVGVITASDDKGGFSWFARLVHIKTLLAGAI